RIMRTAISEDLPPNVSAALVNNNSERRRLYNPERVRCGAHARHARGQAARFRIFLRDVVLVLVIDLLGPRLKGYLDASSDHIDVLANRVGRPVPGKIGVAIRRLRYRTRGRLRATPRASPACAPSGALCARSRRLSGDWIRKAIEHSPTAAARSLPEVLCKFDILIRPLLRNACILRNR